MRVSLSDGTARTLFSLQNGRAKLHCARFPSSICVIVERTDDHKELIVTAFDPVKGLGAELTRIRFNPNTDIWDAALSPDGTRISVISGSLG
jgi:hypothetical protein